MKPKKIGWWQNIADKVFQIWFVNKYPDCQLCGKPTSCGHHYFPKSVASALRYEEDNMIPLCVGQHFSHHNGDPRIHAKVLEIRGMDWHKKLEKKKNDIVKPNIGYYKQIIQLYEEV